MGHSEETARRKKEQYFLGKDMAQRLVPTRRDEAQVKGKRLYGGISRRKEEGPEHEKMRTRQAFRKRALKSKNRGFRELELQKTKEERRKAEQGLLVMKGTGTCLG
jgi:hypothetical protein